MRMDRIVCQCRYSRRCEQWQRYWATGDIGTTTPARGYDHFRHARESSGGGRSQMSKLLLILLVASAWLGYAQPTTIEVPQGSGVFPTIGQVNCLEEIGSGRLCAATYECSSGDAGALWGDLANHNGRRAIGATSPVATQRDCVVTVDGKAAVRWFSGYRPDGRTGEVVGLTASAEALRPVQRVQRPVGEDGGSLLVYILERHDTTLPELLEVECGHIQRGHPEHDDCVNEVLPLCD